MAAKEVRVEERHLSLSEAAEALDISERTAYRWVKSGKLKAFKPGRDYWIPESAIREVVEGSEVRPKVEIRSSLEPSLFNGLEDERRIAINYDTCRTALDGFCDYWNEILDADRLDPQALDDFDAAAKVLAPTYLELWSAEKTELGPQEDAGEPLFHSERSALWPAIDRFIALGIHMDRIGREQFGRHDIAKVTDIFTKKAS
jgi:excisionase family DNA binding protein